MSLTPFMQEYPPTDKYVRAVSIRTGYYIHAIDDKSCRFIWISQTDPKGWWRLGAGADDPSPAPRISHTATLHPQARCPRWW